MIDYTKEELVELARGNADLSYQIDCMLEAKQKDFAVFQMMEQLMALDDFTPIKGATFSYNPLKDKSR